MTRYILEIVVFVCGAAVMIFELAGSRVLAPYLGSSIFVWASLIGVILGSLSLGYWLGGRSADRNPTPRTLSSVILAAAVLIGLSSWLKTNLLDLLSESIPDIRGRSIVASLALFALPSVLLGMVSPYAVRLKMVTLATSGRTVGNLYAISTVGSIVGTFLAGFYLIPHFGTTLILYMLSGALVLTSLALAPKRFVVTRLLVLGLLVLLSIWRGSSGILSIETQYNSVRIFNSRDPLTNRPVKVMAINRQSSSVMFLDSDELVLEYTRFFRLAQHFRPDFANCLMLGGAAYSYPKAYLDDYPEATIDVVEIDPTLTELAKQYFRLSEDPRLSIYHLDGRIFLNQTEKTYDVVIGDVFNSVFSIPFHLTTKECAQNVHDILNEDGIAIINIVSAIEGRGGMFLRAEYATYKSLFPQVYLFLVDHPDDAAMVQNVIIVALKSEERPLFRSDEPELNRLLGHLWEGDVILDVPVLTDDHAPVDFYLGQAM